MSWEQGLTEEQRSAASVIDSHVRLLAGPGTGKTYSLIGRISFLLEVPKIPPNDILVLTFTRAAAKELRSRLSDSLPDDSPLPRVTTLHSFALSTLLESDGNNDLPTPLRIADDFEEKAIISQDLKELLGLKSTKEVSVLMQKLSANWERLEKNWEGRFPDPKFLGGWKEHRSKYGYTLRSELVYQLYQGLDLGEISLKNHPRHVLVDEYQDLNACDLAVVKMLSEDDAYIYCAGDDDQSIYGFRQADPEGIRRFDRDYDPVESKTLELCHRCDSRIIKVAEFVANQDSRRINKNLRAKEGSQGVAQLLRFENGEAEANGIARLCNNLIDAKEVPPGEIIILLRSDHSGRFSKPLISQFRALGLPLEQVSNPLEDLDCPVQDNGQVQSGGRIVLSLLRLAVNFTDSLALRTILGLRKNGIGDKTMQQLYELARKSNSNLADAIQEVVETPSKLPRFGSKLKDQVLGIVTEVESIKSEADSDVLAAVTAVCENNVENLEVRTRIINLFERVHGQREEGSLANLLQQLAVAGPVQEPPEASNKVRIMTMHQAKGLSAEAVFVAGLESEMIPGRSDKPDDERRLLYVSLTRAKHFLFMSHCSKRIGNQRHSGKSGGDADRTLTEYLRGGLVKSEDGMDFVKTFTTEPEDS